ERTIRTLDDIGNAGCFQIDADHLSGFLRPSSGHNGASLGRPAMYSRRASAMSGGRGCTAVLPFLACSAAKVTVGGSLSRATASGPRLASSEARNPLAQAEEYRIARSVPLSPRNSRSLCRAA